MAKKLQLRRGTTTQHNSFTGAEGEVTVDTTKDSLVVHDGSTQGGHPIAKSSDIAGFAALTGATFTGDVLVDNQQEVRFGEADGNGTNYVGLKSPAAVTSNVTWTLPAADGSANQLLKTDGSGALGWATDTNSNTTYTISCVDGDNSDEEKIRLTDSGSGTDDVVLEAGTGLSIARSGDKITFTNTVSDTNTTYTAGDGLTLSSTEFTLNLAKDQTWTGSQRGAISALTSAATITIDFGTSNNFSLTTGHAAIAFANPTTEVAGQSGSIFITQGSTGCTAPTWGDQWFFAGGTAPTLTSGQNKIDRIDYIVQEAGKIHVVAHLNLGATS